MRAVAAILAGSLLISPAWADEALDGAIETCRERADPELDIGYARIAARCPQLVRMLESSQWRAWLPPAWREAGNDLSLGGLEELAVLIEREQARTHTGRRPGTGALREIITGLDTTRAERAGFWGRFRHWLDETFMQPAEEDSGDWLERLLGREPLSERVIATVTYAALALVVLLAALIVVNELRAANLFRRRARPRSQAAADEPTAADSPTWHDIERAPPTERPGLLLRLVIERLGSTGRLPAAASLTVGEVEARAALPDPQDRARLGELARAAERARFAAHPAPPAAIERALESGRALLGNIRARSAAA
jgi:hypothetical protein